MKLGVILGLLALLSVDSVYALPRSSTATVSARVNTSGQLVVTVDHTFDRAPAAGEQCAISIFGTLSVVGESTSSTRRRYALKPALNRITSRFRATLNGPVRLIGGEQTQLNVQALASCADRRGKKVTIVSAPDATNVTCSNGLSRDDFANLLTRRMTFVRQSSAVLAIPRGIPLFASKSCMSN